MVILSCAEPGCRCFWIRSKVDSHFALVTTLEHADAYVHSPAFATNIETTIDSSGPITEVETKRKGESGEKTESPASASPGIGSLKGLK